MNGAVSSQALVIVPAPAVSMPAFWIVRVITSTTAFALQLAGIYAAVLTFGIWITVALCAVGGLAILLQHVILWRATTCSLGE